MKHSTTRSLRAARRLALLVLLAAAAVPPASAAPPNIVFIMADDLGWHDVGCYGNDFVETPHLDALARDGIRFTQAYQQTVCSPTRAALLTGMHPVRTGITNYLGPQEGAKFLDPAVVTINERLAEAGYVSGLVGKWHLTGNYTAAKGSPDKHGWDEVLVSETSYIGPGDYFHPYDHLAGLPARLVADEYLTDRLALEACEFIERHHEQPFFLYLSFYSVHTRLAAKPDLLAKYEAKFGAMPPRKAREVGTKPALAAMMESIDTGVGRIDATLRRLGLDERTLFVFTSDNGGEAVRRNRDGTLRPSVTNVAPLRAGKSHLYEGGIRVPLLVRWPGVTPAGRTCAVPVNGLDWYPTFLEAAGLAPNESQPSDGTTLLPQLRSPERDRPTKMVWHYPLEKPHFLGGRSSATLRLDDWKLIEFFDTGTTELYDLSEDAGEATDLSRSRPHVLADLKEELDTWRRTMQVVVDPVER